MSERESAIIIDASFVVHALINPDAPLMFERLERLQGGGTVFHVPALWAYEVTNALYRSASAGRIPWQRFEEALSTALDLPLQPYDDRGYHRRAAAIAAELGSSAAYDAHYLALTEDIDLPMLTADSRLFKAARHLFPKIELVPIE